MNRGRYIQFLIVRAGGGSIEGNKMQGWKRCKKRGKIIEYRALDPGICTPLPGAGRDDIPESNPVIGETRRSDPVRKMTIDGKQGFDDMPEMIPGVPVIFLLLQ
jgi:hypothetical protein